MSAQERLGRAFITGVPEETWAEAYPFLHVDADLIRSILAADPTLEQAIEDGTELALLREALPEGWDWDIGASDRESVTCLAWHSDGLVERRRPTVAAAARAVREALEARKALEGGA